MSSGLTRSRPFVKIKGVIRSKGRLRQIRWVAIAIKYCTLHHQSIANLGENFVSNLGQNFNISIALKLLGYDENRNHSRKVQKWYRHTPVTSALCKHVSAEQLFIIFFPAYGNGRTKRGTKS